MSGGLDSSVAAWLLSRERRVVGLSMLLWPAEETRRSGRCCGALDLGDARRVAQQAGIPHYTLRMDEEFRRDVVDPFVDDYLAGRTPSPCVRCNTFVKFDALLDRVREIGAARLATGHYARIVDGPDGAELHRAADPAKDQSYFLFELRREQLDACLFPLGDLDKGRVRAIAREAGLVVAEKGESMEICFVAGEVADFVRGEAVSRSLPAAATGAAEVVDERGEVLGAGEPYYRYTVGQRRGLRVAGAERRYVLRVVPEENRVVVGDAHALECRGLRGVRASWIAEPPAGEREVTVRIRSRHEGVAARVVPLDDGRVEVELAVPQRAVTPGQAAVFYEGSRVLGGCWIDEGLR
jgi:tRNA-specific 2-thiouridylase